MRASITNITTKNAAIEDLKETTMTTVTTKKTHVKKVTFKTIPNFPNYAISANGDIRNKKTQEFLLPRINTPGYQQVSLYNGSKSTGQAFLVHRLVATMWVKNSNPAINKAALHKDGNKLNNHKSNLYWGTQAMNMHDKMIQGRCAKTRVVRDLAFFKTMYELKLTKPWSDVKKILGLSDTIATNLAGHPFYSAIRMEAKALVGYGLDKE